MNKLVTKSLFGALLFASSFSFAKAPEHKALLFFYAGYCHYCDDVAVTLTDLAQKYEVKVVASSLDRKVLPQFVNVTDNKKIMRKFGITSVPTVIAIDFKTNQFETLFVGAASYQEIEEKVSGWLNGV